MLRFDKNFREILEKKYRSRAVYSNRTGKALRFSMKNLITSIEKFIELELQKHDDELYKIYSHKTQSGFKKDNIYRMFLTNNLDWKPKRDLVDLLCYYAFSHSYETSVIAEELPDNLAEYRSLKTDRVSIQTRSIAMNEQAENNELLEYFKKKVELAKNCPTMEVFVTSLDKYDLKILKQIQPLKESLGEIHWDVIENRFLINPNIVRGLKISTPLEDVIVGFFIIYPITKDCQFKIENSEIQKSDEFGFIDICNNFETATAIYKDANDERRRSGRVIVPSMV